jgi:hypothetical protein
MCKFLLRTVLGLLAIVIAALGIISLTVRFAVLNPDTYKSALESAQVYEKLDSQLTLSPNSNIFLDIIIKKLKTQDVLRTTINNNLDNVFGWLSGSKPELILYFPRQVLLNSFSKEEVKQTAVLYFEQQYSNLPPCTPDQEKQLADPQQGQLNFPDCKPSLANMEQKYLDVISQSIDNVFKDGSPIEVTLREAGLGNLSEQTPVKELLSGKSNEAQVLGQMETARTAVLYWGIISWVLLLVAFILSLIVIVSGGVHLRNIFGTAATLGLLTGILVLIAGLSGSQLANAATNYLHSVSLPVDNQSIKDLLEAFINALVPNLLRLTIIVGIVMSVIMLLLRITAFLIPRPKKKEEKPAAPETPKTIVIETKPEMPEKKNPELTEATKINHTSS